MLKRHRRAVRAPSRRRLAIRAGLVAAGLVAGWAAAGAQAQAVAGGKLVGRVSEERLDVRPDSTGRLIGLIQGGDGVQKLHLQRLAGLLPRTQGPMTVCLRARSRAGTYVARGELTAEKVDQPAMAVQAPGFPRFTDPEVVEPHPDDLAALFVASPCDAATSRVYPASFGAGGDTITAMLNLGQLRATPASRLLHQASGREVAGQCRRPGGRSTSYNVICRYALPPGGALAGPAALTVDYLPARGPGDTADFEVWIAPPRF